jgi:hypothetical protein
MIQKLEELSEKIRNGEPVGTLEAIAAINYQCQLKAEREAKLRKTFFGRMRLCLSGHNYY